MKPTSVIAVERDIPVEYSGLPYVYVNDESPEECALSIRRLFADHNDIAMLGGSIFVRNKGHDLEGVIDQKLKEMIEDLGNCCLDSWEGARNIILNGDSIAKCPTSDELHNLHLGIPAVVIAAGPSASAQFETIKDIRRCVVVFCADSILRGCLDNGIVPDYVCAIERGEHLIELLDGLENCGATLICPPVIEPKCVIKWGKNCIFWWAADDIYRWISPEKTPLAPGRSAGTLAIAAALHAGCSKVYLVGHDLSYKNGKTHDDSTSEMASASVISRDKALMFGDFGAEQCMVESNNGEMIPTRGIWLLFKGDIEAMLADYTTKVINVCGNGGAKISGAMPGKLPDVFKMLAVKWRADLSGIPSPLLLCGDIIETAWHIAKRADEIGKQYEADKGFSASSDALQMSKLCDDRNAPFFQYITRSLYSSMTMRIHLDISRGVPVQESQDRVIRIMTKTLIALMARVISELENG